MTEAEWLALKSQGKVTGNFSMQETAQIRRRLSQDQGRTWQPTTVFSQKPGSFCRHPILELSNGDWLFPMWYSVEDPHSDKRTARTTLWCGSPTTGAKPGRKCPCRTLWAGST